MTTLSRIKSAWGGSPSPGFGGGVKPLPPQPPPPEVTNPQNPPAPVTGGDTDLSDLINQILSGFGGSGGSGGSGGGLSSAQQDLVKQQQRDLLAQQLANHESMRDVVFGNLGARQNYLDQQYHSQGELFKNQAEAAKNNLNLSATAAGNYTSSGINTQRHNQDVQNWLTGESMGNQYNYNKTLVSDAIKKAYIQWWLEDLQLNQQQARQNADIWS